MARYDQLAAIDHGATAWATIDGINAFRPRTPDGKRYMGTFEILEQYLENGFHVSLEIATYGGFGFRSRVDELLALKQRFPGKMLTLGTHPVRNEARRNGLVKGDIPNDQAALINWQITQRDGGKEWPGPTPAADRIRKDDPRRPLKDIYITLREQGYPLGLMNKEVNRYWPALDLDADQTVIFEGHPDRIAAMVMSVREATAIGRPSRDGWESVVQNHRDGHPNIYRQMLSVGKPSKDYVYGMYPIEPSLTYQQATSAMRRLRTMINGAL